MTGTGGVNAACAACKYQRRKCSPDCPLSPYFPPDQPKRFANVHKLFGVSNILRILKHVDPAKREDTVKSIAYEADTREKDPVHGCLGVITVLQSQVARLKDELNLARDQLFFLEQQHGLAQHAALVQQAQQQQQQQQQQLGYGGGGLPPSPFDESQFLRHDPSFSNDAKFDAKFDPKFDAKFDQKMQILPLDYRYGSDNEASLMSQMKADQAEQLRRAGSYFGAESAVAAVGFDESPVSHHQMHLQAALDHDGGDHVFGMRRSAAAAGFAAGPDGGDFKRAAYLTGGHHHLHHVPDHELRRAGVYLTLTNQH